VLFSDEKKCDCLRRRGDPWIHGHEWDCPLADSLDALFGDVEPPRDEEEEEVSELTDKHFKSRHRQRIHRDIKGFLDVDLSWLSAIVGSFCGAALVQFLSEDYHCSLLTLLAFPIMIAVAFTPLCIVSIFERKSAFDWSMFIFTFLTFVFFIVISTGLDRDDRWLLLPPVFCYIIVMNAFFGSLFYYLTYYLWSAIAYILYSPSEPQKEILLIDPDGNPEICNWLNMYPALEGFYGYRLPNAGDLHKIAVYLDNRGLEQ